MLKNSFLTLKFELEAKAHLGGTGPGKLASGALAAEFCVVPGPARPGRPNFLSTKIWRKNPEIYFAFLYSSSSFYKKYHCDRAWLWLCPPGARGFFRAFWQKL